MLPPLEATSPQYSEIGDIIGKYERISTKFSVISLLTRVMNIRGKILEYVIAQESVTYFSDYLTKFPEISLRLISGNLTN